MSKKGSNPGPENAVKPPPPPAPPPTRDIKEGVGRVLPQQFKPVEGKTVYFSPHDVYKIGHVWSSGKFMLKPVKTKKE